MARVTKTLLQGKSCYASDLLIPEVDGFVEVFVVGIIKIAGEAHWVLLPFAHNIKPIYMPVGSIALQETETQRPHPALNLPDNVVQLRPV